MRGLPLLTLFVVITNGLVAGVFFAFSTFVMRSLGRVPNGAEVMRSINITVINPLFMAAFIGGAVASLALGIFALTRYDQPGMALALIGSLLYLLGTFAVTLTFNVPLNDALEKDPTTWTRYLTDWTFWNHVRTAAATASFATLALSLLKQNTFDR